MAIRGTKGVSVEDPKAFMSAVSAGKEVLAGNPVTGEGLPAFGTQVLMNVINETGALPTLNHRDVQFEGAHAISAEAMAEPRAVRWKTELGPQCGMFRMYHCMWSISTVDRTHYG